MFSLKYEAQQFGSWQKSSSDLEKSVAIFQKFLFQIDLYCTYGVFVGIRFKENLIEQLIIINKENSTLDLITKNEKY